MKFENLSLLDIQYLLEVHEEKSIRRVAIKRNIAQPALSRKIQNIENCLGAPVFQRNQKGVVATSFGRICLQMLAEWRADGFDIERKITENHDAPTIIRLGTYDSVGIYFFPRLLKLVQAKKLNFSVELHLGRSSDILRKVADRSLDLGLVFCGGKKPANLKVLHVAEDAYGFFESAGGRASDDFYTLGSSSDELGLTVEQHIKDMKLGGHRVVDVPSFEIAASLCLAGLGIGVLPIRVAEKYLKTKKLRQIRMGFLGSFGSHKLSVVKHGKDRDKNSERLMGLIAEEF